MSAEKSGWGGWTLDEKRLVLEYDQYEVDLERSLTGAQVCDWIFQVAHKNWATPEVTAGLVRALDDLLQPQANLCSGGENKELSNAKLRRLVAENAGGQR